ncbi:uncharacterized protein LOC142317258 isoform X2 [Lycorma delicatula]|uniref:uncharacterized protein LOC142317258 isoform X2 n=1 Tax=Lycorma delicatula TaxID=130591 RepID=UPI003F51A726
MRKPNCSMFTTPGACAMYKLEKNEHIFSWKVLRWALIPSAILLGLALTMYCIVDDNDASVLPPHRHRYVESNSVELEEAKSVQNLEEDVVLDFEGATHNFPMPTTIVFEEITRHEDNYNGDLNILENTSQQDMVTSEVTNNLNWLVEETNKRITEDSKTTSKSPALQEMTTTLHGTGISGSFVDRLILSFDSTRKSMPTTTPPTIFKGISISPRGDSNVRRRLPNGHKYGEYQASPTAVSKKGHGLSTSTPRVSPTLPAAHSPLSSITPVPQNQTEYESQCQSPKLSICRGVLPWDLVAEAIVPGIGSFSDLESAMPYFDMILDSGCSPRAREFICSLLEPECQSAGNSVLPPCRKACKAVAEDCSEFIVDTLDLSKVFNCDAYPDLHNPGECVNLARGEKCLSTESQCPDETCIPKRWVCDNTRDCPLGEDEVNCTKCNSGEFKCHSDHKCIPNSWKCDGNRDCTDGSDEVSCSHEMIAHGHTSPCPPDELRCVDGRCITVQQICDKTVDCADGADEANCNLPFT